MPLFKLNDKLIPKLRKPYGKPLDSKKLEKINPKKLVAVGDGSLKILLRNKIKPKVAITDGKINRKPIKPIPYTPPIILKASNRAGQISQEAWQTVKQALAYKQRVRIKIKGEEDLLLLAVINFIPKGWHYVYGLFKKGILCGKVNQLIKKQVASWLNLPRYKVALIGGTWDRFHAGHRYLLLSAAESAEKLRIGITIEKFAKKKSKLIQSLEIRKKKLDKWLRKWNLNYSIESLPNKWGSAISCKAKGKVLVLSDESWENGVRLNKLRQKKGLEEIQLKKFPLIKGKDGKVISSSRIRKNEIDEDGLLNKDFNK